MLEVSLTLALFLTVTLGMFDLGVGVFRYHVIAQAARQGARRAIVHGALADRLGSWGTADVDVLASAGGSHDIVDGAQDGVQDMLVACELDRTQIQIQWLDGTNELEARVRVTVSTPYQPVMLFIFGNQEIDLTASSTMQIAH